MTKTEIVAYVEDAILRLSTGMASENGSHAAGIFNKAANGFERQITHYTATVTGRSNLHQRTLGALVEILEKLPDANRKPLRSIITGSNDVNDCWKRVKHGADPPIAELLKGLRRILDVLGDLP